MYFLNAEMGYKMTPLDFPVSNLYSWDSEMLSLLASTKFAKIIEANLGKKMT